MTTPTKPMKLLSGNKRGMDYYVFIVSLVGVLMLSFITFSLFTKQYSLSSGLSTGTEQFRVLKTYAAAEKALLFADDAARLALEQAAYKYGKSGFYYSGAPCGSNGGYNYWAKDEILQKNDCVPQPANPSGCYPDEPMMKWTLSTFFYYDFYKFVSKFNSISEVKIPFNYEPFGVATGSTQIIGISKDPITISIPNVKYEVKPGFRESINRDLIGDGSSVVAVAKQLAGKSEKEAKKIVSSADSSDAGSLDWNEKFAYSKAKNSCLYAIGSCTCCETIETCEEYEFDEEGNPVLDDDGKIICKKKGTSEVPVGDGTEYRTIPYDSFDIPMSVRVNDPASGTSHKQYLVYDEAAKKEVLKELEYNFAVNWIEDHPEDSTTSCSCGTGHPC
ncbi:hypothetical protein HYU16_02955 [Candidatus Woesearchaeota archaeon]|nr:hypothetical protein [Candidatus Woesearchaeota archaeon]